MSTDEIIAKFDTLVKIYQSYSGVPNVLDFVGLDENAHTRVISMLLDYRRKEMPVFLESFLSKLSDEFARKLSDEDYAKAQFQIQSNYIDCLIRVGNYAIVIENKIHGARDQIRQIETYIDQASKEANIVYAVYLTFTGGEPSQHSLSDDRKKIIGKRFVTINYQTQILEWLQEDVLPECKVSDHLLENSVRLYIDHLNGMLGQKNIEREMVARLSKEVNLEVTPEYYCFLQQTLGDPRLQSDDRMSRGYESFSAAIQVLLRKIEKTMPYVNEDNVGYVLKGLFRNTPPWQEKSTWIDNCANVDPFLPSVFMYCGVRHLKLSGELKGENMEIHMPCSAEGIKNGPYILLELDEAESLFGEEYLKSIGLVRERRYRYPFDSFNIERTPLLGVALHIKQLVDGLKNSPAFSPMKLIADDS